MKKVLITGGAGMIGSNLSQKLLNLDYKVYILDDFSSGLEINIPTGVQLIKATVTDKYYLQNIFKEHQFNIVFHLAALFANQNSVDHPEKDLEVNGIGTLNILQESLRLYQMGVLQRFIYASSSCVYGGQGGFLIENAPKNLETPYAITKLLGEYYCDYFQSMYRLPTTTYRFFNSYGPGELPGKYRNVIPNFIEKALKNETLFITGDGQETRDFTFINDTIHGLVLGLNSETAIGKTYNIATGKETTIIELAKTIIRLTNSSSTIEFKPRRDWDHTLTRCGNIDLIKEDLGYHPSVELESGLIETIQWIKKYSNN